MDLLATESAELYPEFKDIHKDHCKHFVFNKFSAAEIDVNTKVLIFPTTERWLNGEEYAFLLRHYKAYNSLYPTEMLLNTRTHPQQVYDSPRNGQIYFIKGWHLREFGFPRQDGLRKEWKWKKMNFTTDLPKNAPLCSYLVATGKVDRECYRMHVVVNSMEYSKMYRQSDVLKDLRANASKSKSKLLA